MYYNPVLFHQCFTLVEGHRALGLAHRQGYEKLGEVEEEEDGTLAPLTSRSFDKIHIGNIYSDD